MAERATISSTKRIAVVTGANKGIGLEICRQLASNGVTVVLTARDEKRGAEAVQNLRASGLADVLFHQLDVADAASIASLADFLKTKFGKLDILVNNAGVFGVKVDAEARKGLDVGYDQFVGSNAGLLKEVMEQTYETAEACLRTNYYGIKLATQALIPLLELSISARVVNVSSVLGQLKLISNEKAKEKLGDADGITEQRVGEAVKGFLEDVKEDLVETKGWPVNASAYIVSKAALNAYTRVLAKKYPSFVMNSVCPGFVKTDLNFNSGILTVEEGAKGPVMLALMPDGGPSGLFFIEMKPSEFSLKPCDTAGKIHSNYIE